jgi:hypothetical protein
MNATHAVIETRRVITRPAVDTPVWTDASGKTHKQDLTHSTKTFVFVNGKQYRLSEDIAVLEKSTTKAILALPDRAERLASPKWAECVIRKGIKHVPAHRWVETTLLTTEWKQTPIAYYGIRLVEHHAPNVFHKWASVCVNVFHTQVYSHEKTAETPHPIPFCGDVLDDLIRRDGGGHLPEMTDALRTLVAEETARQRTPNPIVKHLFANRTHLWRTEKSFTWRPRQEGVKAKTIKHLGDAHTYTHAEPVFPIVFLTDASTKAGVPSAVKPLGVYGEDRHGLLHGRVGVPDILASLESIRTLRGELKRLLAEAVYETNRMERVATAHGVDFETYLLALSGETE